MPRQASSSRVPRESTALWVSIDGFFFFFWGGWIGGRNDGSNERGKERKAKSEKNMGAKSSKERTMGDSRINFCKR